MVFHLSRPTRCKIEDIVACGNAKQLRRVFDIDKDSRKETSQGIGLLPIQQDRPAFCHY
mgnify:CR=1 FL=1